MKLQAHLCTSHPLQYLAAHLLAVGEREIDAEVLLFKCMIHQLTRGKMPTARS